MSEKFQVVVVGGGPGGYVCSIRLAQLGYKTACVDSRGVLGGTCLNVGCIPSKSLLNLSEKFHSTKNLSEKGIEVGSVKLNLEKMMKNKEKAVLALTKGVEFLLKKNKVVGITGLDTRGLTNFIRDKGAPKGTISYSKKGKFNINKLKNLSIKWNVLKNLDLAENVTTKKNYKWVGFKTWKKESRFLKNKTKLFKVLAIDYGIKKNILRYFSDFKCEVNIISCKTTTEKILKMKPDGVFLSNGPGDPAATGKYAIGIIKTLIKKEIPIFGICLGHQILALALGAKTKKMKLGHRGANHPVKNLINSNVEITSQNHGFEIVKESLPKNVEITHKSLFDNCIEGIRLKNKPVFSVQYHPESNPGPQDSVYLFQEFINNIKKNAKKKRS